MSVPRSNYFTFELFPESAGDLPNIKRNLSMLHVPCLVSPLHSADGEICKPHFHCVLLFDSLKSVKQVTRVLQDIFGTVCLFTDEPPYMEQCQVETT